MNKNNILFILVMVSSLLLNTYRDKSIVTIERAEMDKTAVKTTTTEMDEMTETTEISVIIGNQVFRAQFYQNPSTKEIMAQMPFTLNMKDFASQEKVDQLTFPLPSAQTEVPSQIRAGEIYLWSEIQLVLFYRSFSTNTYNYTPVGYVEDVDEFQRALGSGDVDITFTIKIPLVL